MHPSLPRDCYPRIPQLVFQWRSSQSAGLMPMSTAGVQLCAGSQNMLLPDTDPASVSRALQPVTVQCFSGSAAKAGQAVAQLAAAKVPTGGSWKSLPGSTLSYRGPATSRICKSKAAIKQTALPAGATCCRANAVCDYKAGNFAYFQTSEGCCRLLAVDLMHGIDCLPCRLPLLADCLPAVPSARQLLHQDPPPAAVTASAYQLLRTWALQAPNARLWTNALLTPCLLHVRAALQVTALPSTCSLKLSGVSNAAQVYIYGAGRKGAVPKGAVTSASAAVDLKPYIRAGANRIVIASLNNKCGSRAAVTAKLDCSAPARALAPTRERLLPASLAVVLSGCAVCECTCQTLLAESALRFPAVSPRSSVWPMAFAVHCYPPFFIEALQLVMLMIISAQKPFAHAATGRPTAKPTTPLVS